MFKTRDIFSFYSFLYLLVDYLTKLSVSNQHKFKILSFLGCEAVSLGEKFPRQRVRQQSMKGQTKFVKVATNP